MPLVFTFWCPCSKCCWVHAVSRTNVWPSVHIVGLTACAMSLFCWYIVHVKGQKVNVHILIMSYCPVLCTFAFKCFAMDSCSIFTMTSKLVLSLYSLNCNLDGKLAIRLAVEDFILRFLYPDTWKRPWSVAWSCWKWMVSWCTALTPWILLKMKQL